MVKIITHDFVRSNALFLPKGKGIYSQLWYHWRNFLIEAFMSVSFSYNRYIKFLFIHCVFWNVHCSVWRRIFWSSIRYSKNRRIVEKLNGCHNAKVIIVNFLTKLAEYSRECSVVMPRIFYVNENAYHLLSCRKIRIQKKKKAPIKVPKTEKKTGNE